MAEIKLDQRIQDVIIGLVGRMDVYAQLVRDALGDAPKIPQESDTEQFLEEMALAGFFQPMVLKLQRPITSNDPNAGVLAYNEDRTLFCPDIPITKNVYALFGQDLKVYVFARVWTDGTVQIVKKVEAQSW